MANNIIETYIQLVDDYLNRRIDVRTFESQYLTKFKNDAILWADQEFETLTAIFTDLDANCDDPDLRGPEDLNEEQLLSRTKNNFYKLKSLKNGKKERSQS